jgi:acyl-CoA thioesterase-1
MQQLALDREQIEYLVQFNHPEKALRWFPMESSTVAQILGIGNDFYDEIRFKFESHCRTAAEELLADPEFARKIDALPLEAGSTLVGLGDSITDDYQSWFEIFRHVIAIRRSDDGIQFVNHGVSGDTSSQILARFMEVAPGASWIFALIGTNDARRITLEATKTLVSIEETKANFDALIDIASRRTFSRWVWITPPPCVEEAILESWLLAPLEMTWLNQDLGAIADVVRQRPEISVDTWPYFEDRTALMLEDGLHPNLRGNMATLRAVVDRLAQETSEEK